MKNVDVLVELNLEKIISVNVKEGEDAELKASRLVDQMIESDEEARTSLSSLIDYERYVREIDQEDKMFILVKKAIDSFDPYFVPPDSYDEYDGESKRISEKIEEEMTMEEIAEIMKDEFNWSFSADFTREDFFWSAERVYNLLHSKYICV